MASGVDRTLHYLRQAALCGSGLTDGQLLQRYVSAGDGAAFAALVRRHGPMVLGVCRRVLGDFHDAEDAFQTTFLVLARKAASIVPAEAVGPWLYGVAYRAAQKAREAAVRRRAHESRAGGRRFEERPHTRDLVEDLDREISRLPDIYRQALVLCALQGVSRAEAARQLDCPEGTLSSRLAKARRLLSRRLGGPAGVAVALTAAGASQAADLALFTATAGAVMSGVVSGPVVHLTRGVLTAMLLAKVRSVASVLLVASTLAAGAVALALGAGAEPVTAPAPEEAKSAAPRETIAARRFEGHTDGVMVVAFSPDGKRILSGGVCYGARDPTVRLWDVGTGKELLKLEGHTEGVYSLAFLPGGKKAVSGSADGTVRLWDLEAGQELKRYEGHEGTVYGLDVSRDGKLMLTGGEDGTMRLWDVEAGKEVRRYDGHESKVRAVAFSADGKQAASGCVLGDGNLRLWDVKSGEMVSKYPIGSGGAVGPALGRDGGLGGFGGLGPGVGLGDASGVASVAFSPDGKLVLAGCLDNVLRVFELSTGKERKLEGHTQQLHGAVFTPDGKRILSASYDQTVRLWDVESGKEVCRFFGHTNWVWGVAVSPDGKLGLSGSLDKTVRLWKLPK
jgi:RNA polymerase sigma factor (sigma-70 family)